MKTSDFSVSMEIVISALKEKGYNPYDQLYGYVHTGNPIYITQHGDAREIIQELDKSEIRQYIEKIK